jgi:FixJ family two-component response regulator
VSSFLSRVLRERHVDHDATVYVVDDDQSTRTSLARLLQAAGFDAQTFASGRAFLDRARPGGTACVILDMRLPEASGLDVQAKLGEAQQTLPIIFLTGYAEVAVSVSAMKNGAVDFLEKPCDERDLLAAVGRALARSRAERARIEEARMVQRRVDTLTRRERQVLALVVRGLLNKQIAGELGAAEKTIKIHRGRMMKKMGVDSVASLVRMAELIGVRPPLPPLRTGTDG